MGLNDVLRLVLTGILALCAFEVYQIKVRRSQNAQR